MKKIYFVLFMQCFCTSIMGQYGSKGVYTTNRQSVVLDNKTSRNIYGGTVIKPTFFGSNFNPTIRNAFDYACKIWEEQIPTIYPLNIEVRIASLLGDSTLAMVEPQFTLGSDSLENAIIKRYAQFNAGWETGENDFINNTDAIITFNSNKSFCYNTDVDNIPSDKYDFITVAIQAIGKALGFYMMAYYNGAYLFQFNNSNKYTKYIMNDNNSIGYTNTLAYINNRWALYRPSVYNTYYSLNYFTVSATNDETQFMQPGIPLGTAIRYIGNSMQDVFYVLDFERPIATGINNPTPGVTSTSPEDVFDYSWGDGNRIQNGHKSVTTSPLSYTDYFSECSEIQPTGKYILKANGAWKQYSNLSDIDPRDSIYSRSYDGYLRTMEVSYQSYGPGWSYGNLVITHKLYKCPPLRPEFDMNGYSVSEIGRANSIRNQRRSNSYNITLDDDDFLDVEIGFEKTEGCVSVLVEQTDSDWPIPYTYFVDPSEGRFTAYMTRPYPSTFKLTYINSKGQTTSQPKTIDLSSTLEMTMMTKTLDNGNTLQYSVDGKSARTLFSGTYSITDLNTNRIVKQGLVSNVSGYVDISNLPNSLYSFTIRDNKNKLYTTKWKKQ